MHSNNEKNKGWGSYWQEIFKALSELRPAHPFEFGPKTLPLPRVLARAIAGEQNTQSNPDTAQSNNGVDNKKENTGSEPDITPDQDEHVTNDKDDPSNQAKDVSD